MRDDRVVMARLRGMAPLALLGVLLSWLVIQNAALLVLWSWPAAPALLAVGRALLKVAAVVAIQLTPAMLVACGVAMLWVASRRSPSPPARRIGEARHV
jgi:hypothetical protein